MKKVGADVYEKAYNNFYAIYINISTKKLHKTNSLNVVFIYYSVASQPLGVSFPWLAGVLGSAGVVCTGSCTTLVPLKTTWLCGLYVSEFINFI